MLKHSELHILNTCNLYIFYTSKEAVLKQKARKWEDLKMNYFFTLSTFFKSSEPYEYILSNQELSNKNRNNI